MNINEKTYDLISYMEDLVKKYHEEKEWWTLKKCCERKGINYKSACNRKYLQPNEGVADAHLGGRKVWHHTTVEKWLPVTDTLVWQEGEENGK